MENPNKTEDNGIVGQPSESFKKNDFIIAMDSVGDGFEMFIQKSADVFFDLGKDIKEFFANMKKFLKNKKSRQILKNSPTEKQLELSKKIYREHKRLERQLEKLEASITETHELAGQIKEDT